MSEQLKTPQDDYIEQHPNAVVDVEKARHMANAENEYRTEAVEYRADALSEGDSGYERAAEEYDKKADLEGRAAGVLFDHDITDPQTGEVLTREKVEEAFRAELAARSTESVVGRLQEVVYGEADPDDAKKFYKALFQYGPTEYEGRYSKEQSAVPLVWLGGNDEVAERYALQEAGYDGAGEGSAAEAFDAIKDLITASHKSFYEAREQPDTTMRDLMQINLDFQQEVAKVQRGIVEGFGEPAQDYVKEAADKQEQKDKPVGSAA